MSNLTLMQQMFRQAAIDAGVDPDILDAADHPAECRCPKCFKYWVSAYPSEPDDDVDEEWWDMYCDQLSLWRECSPFTMDEIGEGMQR